MELSTHKTLLKKPERRPLRIRRAQFDDMRHVANIIRSSASWYAPFVDDEDMDQHDVDDAWARDNFRRRDFFVGEEKGEVVATVTLQDAGTHSYLGYVYVHAEHTGRGIGKHLLRFAREESKKRGDEGLVLIAHPKAHWACKAYERFGFEVVAKERAEVLSWNDGFMKPFYENGFHLYEYTHEDA